MKSVAVEPTESNASHCNPESNSQSNDNSTSDQERPESYQSAPTNPPPPYEFSGQPHPHQYPGAQPGAPAFIPGGQQSVANPYPATGYVYGSGTTGYIQTGCVIAPVHGSHQPVSCTAGGYVVQPLQSPTALMSQQMQQMDNYCGYIVLAAVVFMCFCPILGFIAGALAGFAQVRSAFDRDGARRMARVSLALSISGLVIAVIIVIVVVSVLCSNYRIDGQCFRHRERSGSFGCSFDHSANRREYYEEDGYCYWN